VSDKTNTTMHSAVKNVLPSFDPREPDKAELYVHDLQTSVPTEAAMHLNAETRKPGTVSHIIKMPEVKERQVAMRFEDAPPPYGKSRIVDFLADEMSKKQRLKENDTVDVVIDVEPQK
jgi:hypothetical protein